MKSMNRTILGLVASVVMVGALSLLGCSTDDESGFRPATAADVLRQAFTCPDGEIFSAALKGAPATLEFGPDGTRFRIAGRVGDFTFGPPCKADFDAAGVDDIVLPGCDFNPDDNLLFLVNAKGVSAFCGPGRPTGTTGFGGE